MYVHVFCAKVPQFNPGPNMFSCVYLHLLSVLFAPLVSYCKYRVAYNFFSMRSINYAVV